MQSNRKEKMKFVLNTGIFFALFLSMFLAVNRIFLYKDNNYYNYESFLRQDNDTVDILVMGSSHSIDAIDSAQLSQKLAEEEGLDTSVFNMSITGMRIEQIAYRFEEALRTQKPKLLIVETFSFVPISYSNEETIRRYALDYMPLDREKIRFINNKIEDKTSFYVPFIKYHSRWMELNREDFQVLSKEWVKEKSKYNGIAADEKPDYTGERDAYFEQDFTAITECCPLEEAQKEDLEYLLRLADENDVRLLFVSVPYKVQMDYNSVELIKCNNYLREEYVDDERIYLLDLNADMNALHWNYDYMQDEGHVNNKGRMVVMDCLAEYIGMNLRNSLEGR